MKKIIKAFIAVGIIFVLMFAEYRYIMNNIHPYMSDHNTIYLEVFGNVDEYTYCFDGDWN